MAGGQRDSRPRKKLGRMLIAPMAGKPPHVVGPGLWVPAGVQTRSVPEFCHCCRPGPNLSRFGSDCHLTPWNRGVKAHERADLCALCADHPFRGDEALQSLLFGPSNITGDVEQG